MKARIWKQDGIWCYRTYRKTSITALAVYGCRSSWREALNSALEELKWINPQ